MKRPTLFSWYYNQGIHELMEIWQNQILFVWCFFSIRELLGTLFSPWHADVEMRTWRGFHPGKLFELFFENLLTRIVGAVVRIVVILLGILAFLAVLFLGLLFAFLWISAPLLAFVLLFMAARGSLDILAVGIFFVLWATVSIFAYFNSTKTSLLQIDAKALVKKPVFDRICARCGVSARHFPKEIFDSEEKLKEFLKLHHLSRQEYARILAWELGRAQQKIDEGKFWLWENLKKIPSIGVQWRYGYTVLLDRYSQDLSRFDGSEYGNNELIGREEEYEVLKLILSRPDQNCVLITGNSGIGKKTLVHTLARRIRSRQEAEIFSSKRVLLLDLGRAISDAINSGEDVDNFLRRLFFEAALAGNVILVIEHLEHFLGKGSNIFHPDIAPVLMEVLQVPTFQLVTTSSSKEYHQLIEKQEQIIKYFEVIEMRESSEDDTLTILLLTLEKYEKSRILFTWKALRAIINESNKHNWQFPLPERAIDLVMDVLMFWEKKSDEQFVTEKTVADYLSLKTGVQHGAIDGDERKKLLNLEDLLHRHVIGQEEAVKQVAESLRRSRSGIGNSQKPVGSFLFLGPTGVGKTETAKALAKAYFGDDKHMIRLDMSEFQTSASIDRLLGSTQLNQPGRLITQIKDNPYSLLLLDEIEKAYPEILDVFLQILDEGFVTDAFGEKINFRNTIIIATSNAGAALVKKMVEEDLPAEEIKQAVIDHVIENNIFRVEFLNRFEGVIFFRPLKGDELVSVVKLQLKKFARRLAKEKNIEISFGDDVILQIIDKGYNPVFGARSLNRYIEDAVEDLVAKKIIAGEVVQGEKINLHL
ncbi:MAG TPA: AAA family ATPase [Patescibacteria group bacterium]